MFCVYRIFCSLHNSYLFYVLTYQLGSSRAILPKVELRCSLMSLSAAKSLARMPVVGVLLD